ncbi:hypothetical protein [Nostoc sp. NZL]|nr:hypothetical protein [Nostoc sp. NZL]
MTGKLYLLHLGDILNQLFNRAIAQSLWTQPPKYNLSTELRSLPQCK